MARRQRRRQPVKRDHHVGRSWWAPLAELDYRRWRKRHRGDGEGSAPRWNGAPEGILRVARAAALWAIAIIIAAASGASFAESYRGLYVWALHHGLSGFWAAAFALQVDSFIGVGELVLFIATVDQWRLRHRAGAWVVALLGLAVSVAGNIGHVGATDAQSRGTAAVPPASSAARRSSVLPGDPRLLPALERAMPVDTVPNDTFRPRASRLTSCSATAIASRQARRPMAGPERARGRANRVVRRALDVDGGVPRRPGEDPRGLSCVPRTPAHRSPRAGERGAGVLAGYNGMARSVVLVAR